MKNQTTPTESIKNVDEINEMISKIDLQNSIITEVDSINNTIDFLFTRDNCLVDNKNFAIMNITTY